MVDFRRPGQWNYQTNLIDTLAIRQTIEESSNKSDSSNRIRQTNTGNRQTSIRARQTSIGARQTSNRNRHRNLRDRRTNSFDVKRSFDGAQIRLTISDARNTIWKFRLTILYGGIIDLRQS